MNQEKIKYKNTYRILWIALDIIAFFIALIWAHISNSFTSDIDYYTYWGFIVSALASIATILEIANSSANSKSLSEEINERTVSIEKSANELKQTNKLISISECGIILDQIIDFIDSEQFNEAVIYIREIRKNISKTDLKSIFDKEIEVDDEKHICQTFYEMERKIEAYRSSKKGKGYIPKYKIVRAKIFYANFRTLLSQKN